jgi:hypothetical protein
MGDYEGIIRAGLRLPQSYSEYIMQTAHALHAALKLELSAKQYDFTGGTYQQSKPSHTNKISQGMLTLIIYKIKR